MRASWVLTDALSIPLSRSCINVARATYSSRHARQMERLFGPAWHHADFPRTAVGKVSGTVRDHLRTSLGPKKNAELRAKAVELGLVSDEHDTPSVEFGGKGSSSSSDPLLEFLEKNEDEAALLLAMWTSLRRSCLHASEISESISLTARWFLHHLIRMRAIAAAAHFYQRLLALGLQLQKWDVVLLLSNLPYDRCTTVAASQSDEWMREKRLSQWAARRERERRKGGEEIKAKPKKGANNARYEKLGDEAGERRGPEAGAAASISAFSPQPTNSAHADTPSRDSGETVKNALGTVKKTPLRQPDWVRRWLLYEASMGNVEFPDSEECLPATRTEKLDEFCCTDTLGAHEDLLQDSLEANCLMGLTAQLKHLMVLQDAGIFLETKKKRDSQKSATNVWRCTPTRRHRRYWAEALHIASIYMESRPATKHDTSLPDELRDVIRRAVMCSGSWKVCLHYLEANQRHKIKLSRKDYAKFVLMAAEEEPWRKNPSIEQYMLHHFIPHFSDLTAASYAVQAMWLAYACSVKLDRPESYVELIGTRAMNLPSAIKGAIMFAKLAVSHLHIEVERYRTEAAAEQLLATSIRLGLFSHVGESMSENAPSSLTEPTERPASAPLTGVILPEWLRDSFLLVCICLPRVLALAPILVVSQDDAVQINSFLLDALYSRIGVWGIFSRLYLVEPVAPARRTQETSLMAASMALCVLRAALALCVAHSEFSLQNRGVALFTPKQLKLFLGMGLEALSAISSHASGSAELRSFMLILVRTASRLTTEVCRFFSLNPGSERVLFGVTSEETVGSLSLMVQILLLLHADTSGRRFPVATQFRLRSLLRPNSGLGKQVRRSLRQKEARQLDALLCRRGRGKARNSDVSPKAQRLRVFSPEDVARIDATAKMHKLVYFAAISHENDITAIEDVLISRLQSMQSDDAFLLLRVALHHLRLRPGTFGMPFFVKVLQRLCIGATSEAQGKSLWLRAISVYWDAVEHTACHSISLNGAQVNKNQSFRNYERDVLSALLLPMLQLSMAMKRRDMGWVWLNHWVSLHTPAERDTYWGMRNVQARSTLLDRRALHMSLKLILNAQRREAVEGPSVELTPAPFISLHCEVAVRHANWRVALDILLQPFVHSLNCGSSVTPMPNIVAGSALRILCRAPTNMSNTALRLREIQGDQWDLKSANALLLLLVRQRRWKIALQHVKEMLPALDRASNTPAGSTATGNSSNRTEKSEEQLKMNQAFFLLYGLRACAIGGCGEEAAELYDRVKVLLTETRPDTALKNAVTHDRGKHLEELLFASFEPDEVTTTVSSASDGNDQLRIVSGQARRYFLRAMTKKCLFSQGLHK
ncbi:hypothetical protein TcBrA4_0004220 [Trypanosoma cruzi]|nr:hypothetical protein TcBrA4_0004220 [Trypanosoma cruzi]